MPNSMPMASVTAIGQAVRLLAVNLVFRLLGGTKTTLTEINVAMPEGVGVVGWRQQVRCHFPADSLQQSDPEVREGMFAPITTHMQMKEPVRTNTASPLGAHHCSSFVRPPGVVLLLWRVIEFTRIVIAKSLIQSARNSPEAGCAFRSCGDQGLYLCSFDKAFMEFSKQLVSTEG